MQQQPPNSNPCVSFNCPPDTRLVQSKKAGPNQGRWFYTSKEYDYFRWADEVHSGSRNDAPPPPKKQWPPAEPKKQWVDETAQITTIYPGQLQQAAVTRTVPTPTISTAPPPTISTYNLPPVQDPHPDIKSLYPYGNADASHKLALETIMSLNNEVSELKKKIEDLEHWLVRAFDANDKLMNASFSKMADLVIELGKNDPANVETKTTRSLTVKSPKKKRPATVGWIDTKKKAPEPKKAKKVIPVTPDSNDGSFDLMEGDLMGELDEKGVVETKDPHKK